MLRKYLFISIILVTTSLWSQDRLSNRIANYDMDIQLDVDKKMLLGQTTLEWTNISTSPVSELQFHLYYNAFRNTQSTFLSERGMSNFLSRDIDANCGWGWSGLESIQDQFGNDLSTSMEYIAVDDANPNDKTVLRIKLLEPVEAGESQTFQFTWLAKIPQTMPRTGYNKDFYFFAQWFPKVGVYEPAGMRFAKEDGWNCHQYHSSGEYYSDFGNYDVRLEVPKDFSVAASGVLVGQKKTDSTKVWRFKVNDVIDFAWTSSPHFEKQVDTFRNTEILLYTYPEKSHFAERYFSSLKFAMEYLEDRLGPYPYPTISVIDPPIHGMFTGGMEYPTLITSLTFNSFPEGFKTAETLVTHEYIHQYFMQMVANHEVEETWMDEGITTYYENRILDAFMPNETAFIDFAGIKIGSKAFNRAEFLASAHPKIAPNSIKSWEYKHGGYGDITYNKAAMWLQTLEGLVGIESMDEIMRRYFERWKFKHPCRNDFMDVVDEVVIEKHTDKFPQGMQWYFDQVLFGTNECDYAVASINNIKKVDKRGFFDDLEQCVSADSTYDSYLTEVTLHRLGELYLPIEFEVQFDNGTTETYYWSGEERSYRIVIPTEHKVTSVMIDPDRLNYMDNNFINNSLVVEKRSEGLTGFLSNLGSSFMHLLECVSMIV